MSSDITKDDLRVWNHDSGCMVCGDLRYRQRTLTDEEFDQLAREWFRGKITAHHPDGTDYINDDLERAVIEAVGRYAFLPQRTLAGIAAIHAVRDWLEAEDE